PGRDRSIHVIAVAPQTTSRHLFFSNSPAPPEIYTLSLHDALPICNNGPHADLWKLSTHGGAAQLVTRWLARIYQLAWDAKGTGSDRKSTRLNSSHVSISYAVFCLKKKTK